jgi:anti-sigma factor RsiW
MTCAEFVEGFSEYYDGTAPEAFVREAESHLERCATCRRYRRVMDRGAELLRALPEPEVNEDFVPRLRHRLYHVDQEPSLHGHTTSGTTALALIGVALLLAAVAWSPALWQGVPTVELAPIVVSRPHSIARLRAMDYFPGRFGQATPGVLKAGLWDDAPAMLFQSSRLYRRYEATSAIRRTGLEQDR